MSVNIPNGSSWYFYSQLFRRLAGQPTVCPFISWRGSGQEGGEGERDAKFCVNVDVCISSKPFFFWEGRLATLLGLHNLKIHDIFTVCCDNVATSGHSSCPFRNLTLISSCSARLKARNRLHFFHRFHLILVQTHDLAVCGFNQGIKCAGLICSENVFL